MKNLQPLIYVIVISAFFIAGCLPEEQKQLSEGEKLYRAKCTSCHRLLPIEDYPLEKFQEYIGKYGKEMTDEEKEILLETIKKVKSYKQ
jgi:hypothetical protein